jgi:ABC-type branched-subunit amino acid transport system ATPase component/ABC-type branched-subunit amino acid transport system permease subunit
MSIVRYILLGLGSGGVVGLTGLGLVLVYRASGVLNFTGGAVGAFGAYSFWDLRDQHHVNWIIALIVSLLIGALISAAMQWLILGRLRSASPLAKAITTLGLMTVLQEVAVAIWGNQEKLVTSILPSSPVHIGSGLAIGEDRLILVGITLALAVVLRFVYSLSLFGLATTGVAEHRMAIAGLGWSTGLVEVGNWALAGALSAFAGILIAPLVGLSATTLTFLIVPALAAALVGSFYSFFLTLAGAMLLGGLQALLTQYVTTPGVTESVPFFVILVIIVAGGKARPTRGDLPTRLPAPGPGRVNIPLTLIGIGVALTLIWTLGATWDSAIVSTLTLGMVVLSVVVVTGYAGQLSLCQWALAGMGAWIAGRLVAGAGLPFWLSVIIGVLGAAAVGVIVALPALRTRGVNLAVVTLGLASIIVAMIFNNISLTGGLGGTNVGSPHIFGIDVGSIRHPERYATLVLIVYVGLMLVVANVRRGRTGLRLLSVRSSERAAESLGVGVYGAKIYAFGLASAIAALGGIFAAFEFPFISYPTQFDVNTSILVVMWAVIGGLGWASGSIISGLGAAGGVLNQLSTKIFTSATFKGTWLPILGGASVPAVLAQGPDGVASLQSKNYHEMTSRFKKRTPGEQAPPAPARAPVAPAEPVRSDRPPAEMEVQGLTVSFGGVKALADVSFTVSPGEIVGLIGPNGAGKTTLLDAVTGFTRPDSGAVVLNGTDISGMSPSRRARAGLGRSFQGVDLFEELTVEGNLQIAADDHSVGTYFGDLVRPGTRRNSARIQQVVEEFRLGPTLQLRPAELPHGTARRVGVARAMAADPSILFLDEPMAGLDSNERSDLGHEIRSVAKRQGTSVVLVEHDVALVLETCDRIVVLDFGRKIADGTPDEIRRDPAVIAAYLGKEEPVSVAASGSEPPPPSAGTMPTGVTAP